MFSLDIPVGTTVQTPSPEPRDEPPSCFSGSDTSQIDEVRFEKKKTVILLAESKNINHKFF